MERTRRYSAGEQVRVLADYWSLQAIFSELSEKNKDIMILIARSMKIAPEGAAPQEKCGGCEEGGKNESKTREFP